MQAMTEMSHHSTSKYWSHVLVLLINVSYRHRKLTESYILFVQGLPKILSKVASRLTKLPLCSIEAPVPRFIL
uniref:Uncharacterized protein n=1 Tax=Arundo donax TaxID=35708 RepID=A0A0A8ZKQ8_ARUDO